jgi:hypothetical protein
MNSAPAELLHPLSMQHFSHIGLSIPAEYIKPKKTPAFYAGVGMSDFRNERPKAAIPEFLR